MSNYKNIYPEGTHLELNKAWRSVYNVDRYSFLVINFNYQYNTYTLYNNTTDEKDIGDYDAMHNNYNITLKEILGRL